MHPSCPFFKWFLLAAALVSYAASTRASAQSQPTKPDPLAPLLSVVNEDDDEVRLSVSLLKVPVIDFARALHEQGAATGGMNKEWQAQLEQWRAAGGLELVAATGASILPDGSFDWGGTITPHRFVTQNSAAMFWDELQWRTERGFDPSTWENLLERLGEEPRGTRCKGSLTLTRDPAVAVLNMDFAHTPAPETRPTTTWPQPYFPTPRVFFRPWQVATRGAVPVNKVFLLGAQMEAPHDGEMNTGHVLFAAARITRGAKVNAGSTSAPVRSFELQSWSLGIPAPHFLSWLAERKPMIDDGKALDGWLATMGKADGATLLGAASMKLSPQDKPGSGYDTKAFVKSTLKWEDATGFEPSGNNKAFRPRVPECDTYHLTHSLDVSLRDMSGTDSVTPEMELTLELERPPGPARWKKWKRAMELDESDPGAVELAEVNYHQNAPEMLTNTVTADPGKVIMVGAAMKEGQVHAHFVRLVKNQSEHRQETKKAEAAPLDPMAQMMATTTVWQIETPATWLGKLLGDASLPQRGEHLATELLKASYEGHAKVVALSSRTQSSGQRSRQSLAEPVTYFGGEYVNTAPHAQGLYFNMRHHGLERVGERDEWDIDARAKGPLGDLNLQQHSRGAPEWRHWGIWQPGVKKTTSENSGITLPIFPVAQFVAGMTLPLGSARVLAVYQISQTGA
ncbi:MAG TPA: hypothetical protein VK956_11565, partial [Verrucomicrobium sp.]|nr:hypothetical protein [Verrucomicrobium sp.]